MTGLADYHVHPGFSIDAEASSIEDYCRAALARGLAEICFTPHYEVDPVRAARDWRVRLSDGIFPMDDPAWLDVFFGEITAARAGFAPLGLTVRAGLEVGFERGLEAAVSRVTEAYPFDLVLGAVHCLDHVAISSSRECGDYFGRHAPQEMARSYFAALHDAVRSGLFDVMAHLDLYRRHGFRFYGETVDTLYQGLVEPVLAAMAGRGVGLEVNTSSLAGGGDQFYPSDQVLRLARESGVRVYTLGSDAHRVADLGRGLESAALRLKGLGLAPVSLAGRSPVGGPAAEESGD